MLAKFNHTLEQLKIKVKIDIVVVKELDKTIFLT
jgi:hypothetical protein